MRACARSCSTPRDSPGSRTRAAPAEPIRVLACGLCGSDVEKIGVAARGHGARPRGRRAPRRRRAHRADPPPALRRVRRAAAQGTSRPASASATPTIVPGGFAERGRGGRRDRAAGRGRRRARHLRRAARLRAARRRAGAARPRARRRPGLRRAALRGGAARPRRRGVRGRHAAGARRPSAGRSCRRGRALRSGGAARRGRAGRHGARLLARRAGRPRPRLPQRADADRLALGDARGTCGAALELLPELDLPEPTCCHSSASPKGLERYRSGRALKVVFTP